MAKVRLSGIKLLAAFLPMSALSIFHLAAPPSALATCNCGSSECCYADKCYSNGAWAPISGLQRDYRSNPCGVLGLLSATSSENRNPRYITAHPRMGSVAVTDLPQLAPRV